MMAGKKDKGGSSLKPHNDARQASKVNKGGLNPATPKSGGGKPTNSMY